jgi:hypothetical protein
MARPIFFPIDIPLSFATRGRPAREPRRHIQRKLRPVTLVTLRRYIGVTGTGAGAPTGMALPSNMQISVTLFTPTFPMERKKVVNGERRRVLFTLTFT